MRKDRPPSEYIKLNRGFFIDYHVKQLSMGDRLTLLGLFAAVNPCTGYIDREDDELCYLTGSDHIPWENYSKWFNKVDGDPCGDLAATHAATLLAGGTAEKRVVSVVREEEASKADEAKQAEKDASALWEKYFDKFYSAYPKKQKRKKALEFWMRIPTKTQGFFQVIMAGVTALNRTEDVTDPGRNRFIPQPSTWINGECWENEYEDAYKQPSTNPAGERILSAHEDPTT